MDYLGEMGEDAPLTAAFLQSPVHRFVESAEGSRGSAIHWIYDRILDGFFTKMFKDNKVRDISLHPFFSVCLLLLTPVFLSQRVFEDDYVSDISVLSSPASSPSSSIYWFPSLEDHAEVSLSSPDSRHRYVQYDDGAAFETLKRVRWTIEKETLTLTSFSSKVVAPLAGYVTPEEFKITTSSIRAIPKVRVPVLCLNACDVPRMKGKDHPQAEAYASPWAVMATTPKGGHLGYAGTGMMDGRTEARREVEHGRRSRVVQGDPGRESSSSRLLFAFSGGSGLTR